MLATNVHRIRVRGALKDLSLPAAAERAGFS
jgi:hypothetical protein